jgi:hypothetical protein
MDEWMGSQEALNGFADDFKDVKQELQHIHVCVPHVRNSTTHRDSSLLGK